MMPPQGSIEKDVHGSIESQKNQKMHSPFGEDILSGQAKNAESQSVKDDGQQSANFVQTIPRNAQRSQLSPQMPGLDDPNQAAAQNQDSPMMMRNES